MLERVQRTENTAQYDKLREAFNSNMPHQDTWTPDLIFDRNSQFIRDFSTSLLLDFLETNERKDVNLVDIYRFGMLVGCFLSEIGRAHFVLRKK